MNSTAVLCHCLWLREKFCDEFKSILLFIPESVRKFCIIDAYKTELIFEN